MLSAQMQAEAQIQTQSQASRIGRMADNADSVALARMLSKHKESQANATIDMLHRLNQLAYGSNMKTLGDDETIEAIISAMAGHRKNLDIQIEGCAAIANLAGSAENSIKMASLGACHQVTSAMKNHPQDEDVQLWGARALANLVSTTATKPDIIQAGGPDVAKRATELYPNNEDIANPAYSVIARCK